jgi:hypothetical protein
MSQNSCVCQECKDNYEKELRSKLKNVSTYKADTSGCHPCLGLWAGEKGIEEYSPYAFKVSYCCACGKKL